MELCWNKEGSTHSCLYHNSKASLFFFIEQKYWAQYIYTGCAVAQSLLHAKSPLAILGGGDRRVNV